MRETAGRLKVEQRIQELLEQILEDSCTPEQACATCPELLPEVRAQWNRLRSVERQLEALFPSSVPSQNEDTVPSGHSPETNLPNISGFEILQVLGHGGMGIVYRARQIKLNRIVALKMLLSGRFASCDERLRFQREAEAVAALKHPNIVQVYECNELDGQPYFTMEFVEGGSLSQLLGGTPQPARDAAALVATLARAAEVAHHSGIVHRDLKPANVLLTVDGTPKISDFGLARRVESDDYLTHTGARVGTPSYMAPEQAAGQLNAIGPATDVYALGAILYEMLTGRAPF
jgi:serine/threonine-protein kinase